MSEKIDIFKNTNAAPQNGEFFKFAKIGDGVQGTYVDKREGIDGFGNNQIIYVLKDGDKLWNAAFRGTSVVIHERMKNVKLGTIVGFKYDSDGVVKRGANAGTSFRIVNPYFDPKTVDKEWLTDHPDAAFTEREESTSVEQGEAPEESDAMRVPVTGDAEISATSLEAIRSLAKTKGLITDAMSEEEGDYAVEAYTMLDLTEETLPRVIIALTQYKA